MTYESNILDELNQYIKPHLDNLIRLFMLPRDDPQSCYVRIPTSDEVDLPLVDLRNLVAETSNNYAIASRLSGSAKAVEKRAEGLFKLKYKTALANNARNTEGREAHAYEVAKDEYLAYVEASSIVELAASMESAARIASESARKLLDKAHAANIGETRSQNYSY